MSSSMKFTGLEQLNANLKALGPEMTRRVLRKGVAAGARVVRDIERQTAPIAAYPIRRKGGLFTAPGTMRAAVITKFVREMSNDVQVEYIVTFRQGRRAQKSGKDAFYARFVEFGHAGRGGTAVAAHRTLGPALASNLDRVQNTMISTMEAEIAKMPEFQP